MCLVYDLFVFLFFFFQAEDGIRDTSVTGVQTCALPISPPVGRANSCKQTPVSRGRHTRTVWAAAAAQVAAAAATTAAGQRSEERRVGKECRSRGSPDH